MSAKKRQSSSWTTCEKCQRKFYSRPLYQKHSLDDSCTPVFPFIDTKTGISVFELFEAPLEEKIFEANELNIIYLNKDFMTECGMQSMDWVLVKESSLDFQSNFTPIPMQIWPTTAVKTKDELKANVSVRTLRKNKLEINKLYALVQISLLEKSPSSSKVDIYADGNPSDFNLDRLVKTIKNKFKNQPIAVGNEFLIDFYSSRINIKVKNVEFLPDDPFAELGYVKICHYTQINLTWSDEVNGKNIDYNPKVNLDEVGGLDNQIAEIFDTINYIFKSENDKKVPRGIIIYGPNGNGKTMLLEAITNALDLHKIYIDEFPRPSITTSSSGTISTETLNNVNVKEKFDEAIRKKRSAIIVDNLDSIAGRTDSNNSNSSQFPFELRAQMERLSHNSSSSSEIIILATALTPSSIHSSLLSPTLFGKEIEIPVPSQKQKQDILVKLLKKFDHDLKEEDIVRISKETPGYIGADLKGICIEASRAEKGKINLPSLLSALKVVGPSALKSIMLEVPNVSWDDIGGMDDLKFKLKQAIEWPIKYSDSFKRLGISSPKGLLMYGPPGCSKTMVAKAIATESGFNFLSVKGSDLFHKWVGESEKAVQNIFRKARQVAPCILFFDEIDAIGGERGSQGSSSNVHERVLAQLLVEIDGFERLDDVTIIAATNRPDLIDKALTRPGRLDRIIYVPLPSAETREGIFKVKFRKMPIGEDVLIEKLVSETEGYSGAEIGAICQEAALSALEENFESDKVYQRHFVKALLTVTKRTSNETVKFYEEYSNKK